MVASKSALVAFIFTAMPTAWIDLGGAVADDVAADHAVGRAVDDELHQHAGVAAGQRRLHRPERRLVDVDRGELRARLGLGQADDADLRLGEHRGRHVGVIDLRRALAEHGVGEGMALADRDRRQVDAIGDVADRVDVSAPRSARNSSTAMPPFFGLRRRRPSPGRDRRRSDGGRSRTSPGRRRRSIRSDRCVVNSLPCIDLRRPLDGAPVRMRDAVLLHLGAHVGAHVVVEAAQDVVAAIDQRHVGAEAGEDAGELDRDVAAALDQDALRQLRQMKRLVRGDDMLDAGDRRRRDRARRRSRSGCASRATVSPSRAAGRCAHPRSPRGS